MSWSARQRRLTVALLLLALMGAAVALVLRAFRSNLVFYLTPAELAAQPDKQREWLRVGGLVQPGSVQREGQGLGVRFVLTDGRAALPVQHQGVLPDLFAEGKGAVAQGKLDPSGVLQADEVLAKHDENYTPPGVHPGALDAAASAAPQVTAPGTGPGPASRPMPGLRPSQ